MVVRLVGCLSKAREYQLQRFCKSVIVTLFLLMWIDFLGWLPGVVLLFEGYSKGFYLVTKLLVLIDLFFSLYLVIVCMVYYF